MLDDAQRTYIDGLKQSHPGLTDDVLTKTLVDAQWGQDDVREALARYKDTPSIAATPAQTQPLAKNTVTLSKTTPTTPKSDPAPQQHNSLQHAKTSHIRTIILAIGIAILLGGVGAAGYYMYNYTSLFNTGPELTDDNILSHTVTKIADIDMTEYMLTSSFAIVERDQGALSYTEMFPPTQEELDKYARDEDRFRDATFIISELNKTRYDSSYRAATSTKRSLSYAPYPVTLPATITKVVDPLNIPYVYRQVDGGADYALTVTFETDAAVAAATRYSSFYYDDVYGTKSPTPATTSKTVTFSSRNQVYGYTFKGKPTQPKVLGIYDLESLESILSADLQSNMLIEGTVDTSSDQPLKARFRFAGDVVFGDAQAAFDFEGIKDSDTYYGVVHKLPTFFGFLSQIRGKWFSLTQNDLQNYGYNVITDQILPDANSEGQENMKKAQEQARKLLELAEKHKVVRISGTPKGDTIDGVRATKYNLRIEKDALLPFYEDATEQLKTYEKDAFMKRDERTIQYLKSDEFKNSFAYLSENVTFAVWIDKAGFPIKTELSLRYIPSKEAEKLADKQVRILSSIHLTNINEPIAVEIPEKVLPFDDLVSLVTGQPKDVTLLSIQSGNVTSVRRALQDYYATTGSYPDTLEQLTQKRKDVMQVDTYVSSTSAYGSFFYNNDEKPFIRALPQDVYSKAPFSYKKISDRDYELTYEIKLPPFSTTQKPRLYYSEKDSWYGLNMPPISLYDDFNYSYKNEKQTYTPKYYDGTNVATQAYFSKAEQESADDDADGLTNGLEAIFGTDPAKADTDNDGFTDQKEINLGSNPSGIGKLKAERNSSYFGMFDFF